MSEATCAFCDADKVVAVNGVPACLEHVDDAMKPVGDTVAAIREAMAANDG